MAHAGTKSHATHHTETASHGGARHPLDSSGKALRFSLLAIVALIVVVALSSRARALCTGQLRSARTSWKVLAAVTGWFAVSMSIIFANKHLLTDRGFEYPFSLSCATNFSVFALVFAATRPAALRPPPLPWESVVRVVGPIGVLTALDIGCANWALVHLSVTFHTIVRGTVPAFVLCFSLLLGLDTPSWAVGGSVFMVCTGCALAAYSETHCDLAGLALALLSCAFSGLRWALTQKLVHRNVPSTGAQSSARGSAGGGRRLSRRVKKPNVQAALDRSASPLSSMFYVTPACALASGVAALLLEANTVRSSPYLTHRRLRTELGWYVAAVGALVFVLLFCEFGLVRLTSSLSLAVFGVLKELLTIVLAANARGDDITLTNMMGFLLCACGVLVYQKTRAKPPTTPPPTHPQPRTRVRAGRTPRATADGGMGPIEPLAHPSMDSADENHGVGSLARTGLAAARDATPTAGGAALAAAASLAGAPTADGGDSGAAPAGGGAAHDGTGVAGGGTASREADGGGGGGEAAASAHGGARANAAYGAADDAAELPVGFRVTRGGGVGRGSGPSGGKHSRAEAANGEATVGMGSVVSGGAVSALSSPATACEEEETEEGEEDDDEDDEDDGEEASSFSPYGLWAGLFGERSAAQGRGALLDEEGERHVDEHAAAGGDKAEFGLLMRREGRTDSERD